jgi:HlyD family secretion protein
MRSPVDGVVLERFISNERYLEAGKSLLEIGRMEDLEIEADILTLDAAEIRVGGPVEIYGPAIGRQPAKGVVARIHPAGFTKVSSLGVEQQRIKAIIRFAEGELARLIADRHLGVGYRVRVRVFTADKSQAILVPRSAMFRAADNTWQVFAVRGAAARLQSVEVGLMNDEQVEITKGLSEGEPVILAPESTLVNGTRVRMSSR